MDARNANSAASTVQRHTERRTASCSVVEPRERHAQCRSAAQRHITAYDRHAFCQSVYGPPAWLMYMPSYMPRPLTQPPFMQAQFEELARRHQDSGTRAQFQRMSQTQGCEECQS